MFPSLNLFIHVPFFLQCGCELVYSCSLFIHVPFFLQRGCELVYSCSPLSSAFFYIHVPFFLQCGCQLVYPCCRLSSADVFQLLFVTLQWRVFRLEMACGEEEPKGGNNQEILADVEANTKIPVEDFTLTTRSVGFFLSDFIFMVLCQQRDSPTPPTPHPTPAPV